MAKGCMCEVYAGCSVRIWSFLVGWLPSVAAELDVDCIVDFAYTHVEATVM